LIWVNTKANRRIGLVGVPLGFGAGQVGSELGVNAMRLSHIRGHRLVDHIRGLGYSVTDHGDVEMELPIAAAGPDENPKYLREVARSTKNIFDAISSLLTEGEMPVILGGDHTVAIGTFSAVSAAARNDGSEIGLMWFDAHADINTPETSSTGNIHGMPLAALFGQGPEELVDIGGFSPKLDSKYFAHVGARDLDEGERSRIHDLSLRDSFFTMSDIDKRGMFACMNEALSIVSKAPGGFAVTFDIDSIDPRFAPGSGTLVRGGLTYREAHLALEMIAEHGGLRSFEIVEVNPLLDQRNITVELACELILSALGKTIL
jgi:arginase